MKYLFTISFLALSGLSSWFLTTGCDAASISQLMGAAAKCKDDCGSGTHSQGECLHFGLSDPCSTISCILNVCQLPHCSSQASGGIECPTKSGDGCVQSEYDQSCSGNSGWAEQVLQEAGDCQPRIARNRRCLAACGGGTAYYTVNRTSTICDH
jgi:hypothetical protein